MRAECQWTLLASVRGSRQPPQCLAATAVLDTTLSRAQRSYQSADSLLHHSPWPRDNQRWQLSSQGHHLSPTIDHLGRMADRHLHTKFPHQAYGIDPAEAAPQLWPSDPPAWRSWICRRDLDSENPKGLTW